VSICRAELGVHAGILGIANLARSKLLHAGG
jgi:hypothetical protein